MRVRGPACAPGLRFSAPPVKRAEQRCRGRQRAAELSRKDAFWAAKRPENASEARQGRSANAQQRLGNSVCRRRVSNWYFGAGGASAEPRPLHSAPLLVWLQRLRSAMNPVYSPASAGVPFANTKGIGYPGAPRLPPPHVRTPASPSFCSASLQPDSRSATPPPPPLRRTRPASTQEPARPSPAVSLQQPPPSLPPSRL